MSDKKDINKLGLGMSAKTRIIIATVVTIAVSGGVFAVWYYHHKKQEQTGSARVSSAPNMQSIPGAGDPSDRYIAQQNEQNNELEKQARQTAGSAVPTITRPGFIGDPDAFGKLTAPSSQANGAASGPKACPIKKVVVMFRPNPANCSVNNLKIARNSGVTAEELACQGCSLQALKMAGYSAGELKNVGYSAEQLKAAGYSLAQLAQAGFSAGELSKAGYTAKQLAGVGFTAGQLAAVKQNDPSCNIDQLRKEKANGVSAATLKQKGCGAAALKVAGFSAAQLKAAGFSADQLNQAGYSAADLKQAGFSAAALKHAGYSAAALKKAGFSASALKDAGYSATALKQAGFSDDTLKAAGFTPAEIKAADKASKECNLVALKKAREAGVSAIALRKRGCGLAALKAAGFTPAALKAAGFTAKELRAAGFSAGQLRAAGFSANALKSAGFSASALKAAGYSADDLKNAGFSAAQLKAAGFSAAALKTAGFDAKQLRDAGFDAKALKDAGFTATQLKNAGYNAGQLAVAGFSAKQLHAAGFNAKQLRQAGFNAAQLKQAGYSARALKQAGYSDGDLLRAGFTPKQSGYASDRAAKAATTQGKATVSGGAASGAGLANTDISGAHINEALNAANNAVPSADSPEGRLAAMIRASDANMSAQQRQDVTQQLQGAMQMQANRMATEWSGQNQQQYQKADVTTDQTAGADAANGGASSSNAETPGSILKAGSIMFAVLDTSINTDERSPILATIVSGPLKGAKLLGKFTRVNQRVLLSFNLLNDPHYYKSIPMNAVAIDPDTARTAISGRVNNHYLLKYGTVFASAFLSGLSNAILDSNSTTTCSLFGCMRSVGRLNTRQQVTVGLGTVGERFANDFSNKYSNIPPTVKIQGGTGIGILIMSDLKLPAGAVPVKDHI